MYSSAHNCLLSKDGTKLIKASKSSDISKLTGLKTIGQDAFQTPGEDSDSKVAAYCKEYGIPMGV